MHVVSDPVLTSVAVAAFLSLAVVRRYAFYARTYTRFIIGVVIVAIICANVVPMLERGLDVAVVTASVAVAALVYALSRAVTYVPVRRAWIAESTRDPLILDAPFEGTWRVAIGGPDRGDNHHLVASDQRFAYDFIRSDRASLGSPILAPVSGRVVAAADGKPDHRASLRVIEDAFPLGNYVAIDAKTAVVFLCHLQNGSVRVRPGDAVLVGDTIGLCGNSGRTSVPHLHIHAQDLPTYAFNRARGVPIAFLRNDLPRVLRVGNTLVSGKTRPI
jgi:hypothetical protein